MSAQYFADCVLKELKNLDPQSDFLQVRARGKTAVLGYEDQSEWVPIFRIAGGSGAYNVADLQVRHRTTWQPTFIRGVPAVLAKQLASELRFIWESHICEHEGWGINSDQEH